MNKTVGKDKLFLSGDPTLPPGWKIRVNSQGRENFRQKGKKTSGWKQRKLHVGGRENFRLKAEKTSSREKRKLHEGRRENFMQGVEKTQVGGRENFMQGVEKTSDWKQRKL